eukprot:COSAG01_NODE_768_length_13739_cov_6.271334_20_plen_94_part_00
MELYHRRCYLPQMISLLSGDCGAKAGCRVRGGSTRSPSSRRRTDGGRGLALGIGPYCCMRPIACCCMMAGLLGITRSSEARRAADGPARGKYM